MQIGDWSATPDLNDIYREIRALGLETNLAELEAFGFTVVEGTLSADLTQRLKDTVIGIAEARVGRKLDLENEEQLNDIELIPYLLFKDPVIRESVLNPKPLSLITYLLGKHCVLSSLVCHLKGPGGNGLLLHSDSSNGLPEPFSPYSQVANCNYALTDYTEAGGCLAMVPGSHRKHRQPTRWEVGLDGNHRYEHVIPIEVPAGSAIVWHGNTWHGAYARTAPGLRINLIMFFCRPFMQQQEWYRDRLSPEILERNGPRLAQLVGMDLPFPMGVEGPNRESFARLIAANRTQWG